jgi:zinc transport system substrate-binding protein
MRTTFLAATVSTLALTGAALADVPSVAVDIAPVHSLVARVMEGVGSPDLIVQPGASPHGYSLRPAEAEALQNADIVFWVGEELEPWLERAIDSLAGDAKSMALLETEGTTELEFREGATFEAHSHGDEGHSADDHDHDHEQEADEDHDHDAEEEHAHEAGEDEDHEGHDEHAHEHHGHDPHAWLDPRNAMVWLDVIAADLADIDPEHADTYAANAADGKAELETLIGEIDTELDGFRGTNFIVFHDAYHYFENRFDVSAAGSIRLSDASDPSPARIAEIRDKAAELNVSCVFAEPQFNPGLVQTVFEGTDAHVGVLDPLGSDLKPGPNLYPQLIRNLADNLTACL